MVPYALAALAKLVGLPKRLAAWFMVAFRPHIGARQSSRTKSLEDKMIKPEQLCQALADEYGPNVADAVRTEIDGKGEVTFAFATEAVDRVLSKGRHLIPAGGRMNSPSGEGVLDFGSSK
jgi:hypothetical protein